MFDDAVQTAPQPPGNPEPADAREDPPWLQGLNAQQRAAVLHGEGPLLVLAGAGTGKTRTLVSRVARLVSAGTPPERILLLTFTRRAAQQMVARADALLGHGTQRRARVIGGTFHAVGNRLLRQHGRALGLEPGFSVLDAGDAADLFDLVRADLNVAGPAPGAKRFPRKATLAAIYSRTVNAREPVSTVVPRHFPWCADHTEAIVEVFRGYTERKRALQMLDYDDLLLWWRALLDVPVVGERIAAAFDHVLVDEYQDTNRLQADLLVDLRRGNANIAVVGDDAQAIYGFRAATVDNILHFPEVFPGAAIVRLEQSYRSTQPLLDVANGVLAGVADQWDKRLWTPGPGGARPRLVTSADEAEQSERVCDAVLARREAGVALRDQAVLFRAGHHADHLELELARRGIPFVKYGGLKFLEAAHVKDLLALLRLLDNPRDELAWLRVLQLLEGVGPATARRVLAQLHGDTAGSMAPGRGPEAALRRFLDHPPDLPPAACGEAEGLRAALADCASELLPVAGQVARLRTAYAPLCERAFGGPAGAAPRLADLEQLELVAASHQSRSAFVAELVLDPPAATSDLAGPPLLDEDWLVLSTIHSAKGLEWDSVHLLHAADGMIPSDMATGSLPEIAEERRLLYVALTRARRELDVHVPLRYHHQRYRPQHGHGADGHGFAQRSRFLTAAVVEGFDLVGPRASDQGACETGAPDRAVGATVDGRAAVGRLLDQLFR